jgi:hypothetical protein
MGLDVEFFTPDTKDSVVYLKNHGWFFDQFGGLSDDLVSEGFTDFYIEDWAFDIVEGRVRAKMQTQGIDASGAPVELPEDITYDGDEDHPWSILMHFYLQVLEDLRAALTTQDRLICSWSA